MRRTSGDAQSDLGAPRGLTLLATGPWPSMAFGLLIYLVTLGNDFTYDDNAIVRENARVRDAFDVRALWLTDWWNNPTKHEPILDPGRDRLYRPLTMHSFAAQYAIHGLWAPGFHAINVSLHIGCCWLVWLLGWRILHDRVCAAAGSVLFAAHPVHVEAVANVVGRAEVLAALLLLGGLIWLLPARRGPVTVGRTAGAAALFLLAVFAKETAICYPALAALALWWGRRGSREASEARAARGPALRWWAARLGVLFAPMLIYFPMRVLALEGRIIRDRITSILFNPLFDASPLERFWGALSVLGHYVRLTLFPEWLSCDYGLAILDPARLPDVMSWLGMVGVAALVFGVSQVFAQSLSRRAIGLLSGMFVVSYALVSNTMLLIGVSVAERLMYWPSAPLLIALGTLGVWGYRRFTSTGRSPLVLQLAAIVVVAAFGARSLQRSMEWIDDRTLFATDVARSPKGAQLNSVRARQLLEDSERAATPEAQAALLAEAAGHAEAALAIRARFPDAVLQLGLIRAKQGRLEDAERLLVGGVMLAPDSFRLQEALAAVRALRGAWRNPIAELEAELERDPGQVDVWRRLVAAQIAIGGSQTALDIATRARERFSDDVGILRAYGDALVVNLRRKEAIDVFGALVAADPEDWEAHVNLTNLIGEDDPGVALDHARRAIELHPDDVRTQVNLAEALVHVGSPDEALARFRSIARRLEAGTPLRMAVEERIRELGGDE